MFRNLLLVALTLFIVGASAVWHTTTLVSPSMHPVRAETALTALLPTPTTDRAFLRGFDSTAQEGRGLLDARAEVLFDAAR